MTTKFNIGDFSRASGIPAKTLRFYHEKGILIPAAIDSETGYRLYDERCLERARIIVALRKLDFSLDEIAAILAVGEEDGDVLDHLAMRKKAIAAEISRHRNMIAVIDAIISAEQESRKAMDALPYEAGEKATERMLVAGIRMKGRYGDCGPAFGTLGRKVGRFISGKPMCLYYDGEYREDDADFEPCFPVSAKARADGVEIHEVPAGSCLHLLHAGPYEELGRSYAKVLAFAQRGKHNLTLPSREIFHKGPGMIFRGNPRKYLTEIQIPLA